MRKRISQTIVAVAMLVAVFCMYLVLAGSLTGCQSTDLIQKTTQARTAYTGALTAVNQEFEAGKLTKADLDKIEPYKLAIDSALNAMQGYATSDPNAWAAAFQNFTEALNAFNAAKGTTP